MGQNSELGPADLRRVCDVSRFAFESTAELPFTDKIIGQPRGTRSIEFGIEITSPGFNIYVLGPVGTGRTTTIERFLQEQAAAGSVPADWVYVQNFQDPRRPRAIRLPAGFGGEFCQTMAETVAALQREIPKAFEAEEYKDALTGITQELEARRNRTLQGVRREAAEQGFAIIRTPEALMVTPLVEGQPMTLEAYEALPQEQQEALDATRRALERKLDGALQAVMALEQEAREAISAVDRRVGAAVADRFFEPMKAKYAAEEEALLHLGLVRQDVVDHVDDFRSDPAEQEQSGPRPDPMLRYQVNLIVDHSQTAGAPVVVENNPTYHNLVGRIEYEVHYGAATTSFANIKAGALHRANGGYLVIRAGDLLSNPNAWQALKRALTTAQICMEEPAVESTPTKTLDPEPIPLQAKIVLMGSPLLYYALYGGDEDFAKLFKVKAEFATEMDRTPENEDESALFVAARCHDEGLRHFDRAAVGKVIEYGSRLAGAQDKLTTRFGEVVDILREASYWAGEDNRQVVGATHVERAVEERIFRSNLIEEQLRRQIAEGQLLIDTAGHVVGQVNGLYFLQAGDHSFGQPSRITARTYMGREGVVSIEREVELAGPIHDRGVLTLIGYLGGRYAQAHPLSLSASLAFEQNYGGVEGDSASTAELYALLSSLSGIQINQAIAVTGSVNQRGQVQPIGGVTHKIEGFFDVCRARGLTGEQGVIIPAANLPNLMLREDLIAAVEAGQFHVWAVTTVDEGIELLTGVPAGELAPDGSYPAGSVHAAVQERLRQLATGLAAFGQQSS